jgi:uncharacterized metal-binding protein
MRGAFRGRIAVEIPCALWNLEVHYRIQNRLPFVLILRHSNSFHGFLVISLRTIFTYSFIFALFFKVVSILQVSTQKNLQVDNYATIQWISEVSSQGFSGRSVKLFTSLSSLEFKPDWCHTFSTLSYSSVARTR